MTQIYVIDLNYNEKEVNKIGKNNVYLQIMYI